MKIDLNIKEKCYIELDKNEVLIYLSNEHVLKYYYNDSYRLASIKMNDLIIGDYTKVHYNLRFNNKMQVGDYILVDFSSSHLDREGLKEDLVTMYEEYIKPRREELKLKQRKRELALEVVLKGYKKSNNKNELNDLEILNEMTDLISNSF